MWAYILSLKHFFIAINFLKEEKGGFWFEEVVSLLKYTKVKLIFSMKVHLGYPLAKIFFFFSEVSAWRTLKIVNKGL